MEVIEVYGTRRSGHHGIIGWMKHNFDNAYGKENVHYLNDLTNNHGLRGDGLINKVKDIEQSGAKFLFVSYEDEFTSVTRLPEYSTTKFVVIRDILNNAASRYKAHPRGAMLISEKYVNIWKEHGNFHRLIRYEDFLMNKEERDSFSKSFGVDNIDVTDDLTYCSNIGSSFIGRQIDTNDNYLNRYSMIELPKDKIDLITTDEVNEVRRKLRYI